MLTLCNTLPDKARCRRDGLVPGRRAAMRISKQALFFGLCAFSLAPSALNGGEALQMKVSPAIQRAPAMLTVRVTGESVGYGGSPGRQSPARPAIRRVGCG